MKEVTFIFVNRQTTLMHRLFGIIINAFEHSTNDAMSHVAIQFDDLKGYGECILEATHIGVTTAEYTKYDNDKKQCRITIGLTDEQYAVLEAKALEIIDRKYKYSYKACIIGGIANSVSRTLGKFLARILKADTDSGMNCSETAMELIREPFKEFCDSWADSEITPYDIYINLMINAVYGFIKITKATRYS